LWQVKAIVRSAQEGEAPPYGSIAILIGNSENLFGTKRQWIWNQLPRLAFSILCLQTPESVYHFETAMPHFSAMNLSGARQNRTTQASQFDMNVPSIVIRSLPCD
jgi:hypothetical protein